MGLPKKNTKNPHPYNTVTVRMRPSGRPSRSSKRPTLQSSAKWRIISSQRASMEAEAIAEILGGRRVLGKAIKNPDDLAQLVRTGLPAGSVSALAERLHLGNGVLSRKLGIPQRTLTRRLSHGSLLTAAESDRTVRMARV